MAEKSPMLTALEAAQAEKLGELPPDRARSSLIVGSFADYFAAAWLKIGLKEAGGGLAPFVYNPIQMDHLAGIRRLYRRRKDIDLFRGMRDLILKPRRLGFSTYIASLYFLDGLLNPGTATLVMAHVDSVVAELFDIYRIFYETLPKDVKERIPTRRMSGSEMELNFYDENGSLDLVARPASSFTVATAGGKDKRGPTLHNLHCSEAAFYDRWAEVNRSVVQTVDVGGNVVLESTAHGFNHYKDLVDASLMGQSLYRLIFYPWFAFPEYRRAIDLGDAEVLKRTLDKEERVLHVERGVSLEQLAWRRWKLTGMDLTDFHQEFPSSILEAFVSTGRPAFNMEIVISNWEKARKAAGEGRWFKRDEFTTIYFKPEPGHYYVLSADPAEGIDRGEGDSRNEVGGLDYSSASVRDAATLRVMATIHGRMVEAEFAGRIGNLGLEYNEALIVVERNNHGGTVLFVLEQAQYPNLYRHQEYDAAGQIFLKLGFPMNVQTRPLVVDCVREVVKREAHPDPDPDFWKEASFFVSNPLGKFEAQAGRHDDRVMDRAIGTYVCTLGAKAWGGDGMLGNTDASGLPLPTGTVGSPQPRQIVPPPLTPVQRSSTPLDLAPGFAHPIFQNMAAMRDETRLPETPHCSNCVHCPAVIPGSALFCGMHGFRIDASMPGCETWEPKADTMEERPTRVDIWGSGS
jgi:hypothetical protein